MKKVLIVDLRSTAPAYTAYFAKGLSDIGYDVTIAGISRKAFKKSLEHLTPRYLYAVNLTGNYPKLDRFKLIKILEYIINWFLILFIAKKYDCIHIQWLPLLSYSDIDLWFLNRLKKRKNKLFYTVHNFLPHNNTSEIVKERYTKLYHSVDYLVVHSPKTKTKLENIGIKTSDIITIPHGPMFHDLKVQENCVRDKMLVGILGNLKPYKGIEDAIKAIHILNTKNYKFKLYLAGRIDPDYRKYLENLIHQYKLSSKIFCKFGFVENNEYLSILKQLKMSLFPYKEIEQSGAALTSLSLGTPIVGYKIGGLADLVVNGYNGELVEKNNIHLLANAILKISQIDDDLLEQNCMKSVEKFSWDYAAKILSKYY